MKLPIISEDVGAKIACGRGTGNNFIVSDGLILVSLLFGVYNRDKMGFSSGGSGGIVAVCLGRRRWHGQPFVFVSASSFFPKNF